MFPRLAGAASAWVLLAGALSLQAQVRLSLQEAVSRAIESRA